MIIYKAENQITGEVYIGQTKKKLCEKKRDHVYEAFKRNATNKFHSALRRFGLSAFTWEVIAQAKNYKELSKLEIEFIKRYNSIAMGYNTSIRYDANAVQRINKNNYRNNFLGGAMILMRTLPQIW